MCEVNNRMSKRIVLLFLFVCFVLSISGSASAANWTVGPNSTYNYQSIQSALDNNGTNNNDTITVYSNGTNSYNENLNIKKRINLVANGSVTVKASNSNLPVITIWNHGINSIITGFNLVGGTSGIVTYADNCQIIGNNITIGTPGSSYSNGVDSGSTLDGGIAVEGNNVTIQGNTIQENHDNVKGIMIISSNSNILNNNIKDSAFGILFGGAEYCNVTGNTLTRCYYGIDVECNDYYYASDNCQITNNTINNSTRYCIRISGAEGDENSIYNFQITGNNLTNSGNTEENGGGIYVNQNTSNINISQNTITSNRDGIDLSDSLDGTITSSSQTSTNINNNTITGNNFDGIYVGWGNINLVNNTITSNGRDGISFAANTSGYLNFNVIAQNLRYGLYVANGTSLINATNNWWGTNTPSYISNSTTAPNGTTIYDNNISQQVNYGPWLILSVNTTNNTVKGGNTTTVTADLTKNSDNQDTSGQGNIPDGTPINFNYLLGTVNTTNTTFNKGKASIIITAGNTSGTANATATVNGCTTSVPIAVDATAPSVSSNIGTGTYNGAQTIILTPNEPATIYYTTDGTDPTTSTTRIVYTNPITINNTTTLKFVAIDAAGNISPVYTQTYTIAGFSLNQITEAASWVKSYIETNKALPSTVQVGGTNLNMAQFLYLVSMATTQLRYGGSAYLTVGNFSLPSSSTEQLSTQAISIETYVDLAQKIVDYMSSNGAAPQNMALNGQTIGYNSEIYLYSRILTYYGTNNDLPQSIVVKTWSTSNIPITDISFTTDQISTAAVWVKNYIETNKALPSTVQIGETTITIAQFLYLEAKAVDELGGGSDTPIISGNYGTAPSESESVTSGSLEWSSYQNLAATVTTFIQNNGRAPNYGTTSLGNIGYKSLVYLFSRVLNYHNTYFNGLPGGLPYYINVKAWSASNIPIVDTFFTVDQITNAASRVKSYIETNKALPSTVAVGTSTLSTTQFLFFSLTMCMAT